MLNHKTIFKQKSKILLTIICIFGLAFSYSCSCRNDDKFGSSGDFTASVSGTVQDTFRVDSQSQKKAGTEDIKISFSAAKGVNTVDNFAVTIEKVEVKEGGLELGTNADDYKNYLRYDKSTGTIQFEKKGLDAIGALISTTAPVDKIVSITFKIDGGEQGSDYITRDFHLIKIQKLDSSKIESVLKSIREIAVDNDDGNFNFSGYKYLPANGTFSTIGNVFTVEDTYTGGTPINPKKSDLKRYCKHYMELTKEISTAELLKEDGGEANSTSYSLFYKIIYAGDYESDINEVTVEFKARQGGGFDE